MTKGFPRKFLPALAIICLGGAAALYGQNLKSETPRALAEPDSVECVILLHGLLRTPKSMQPIQTAFTEAGYHVVNQGYPSRDMPIDALASPTITQATNQCEADKARKIHFVTHSMGGILVRYHLAHHTIDKLGRVVMLAPPNQGSEVPDTFADIPAFEWINGPAGTELGTDERSVPNALPPANFDLGIIAGTRSINLILSQIIPNADDGKVSVERTKLEGMRDHLVMDVSHPLMLQNKEVAAQAIYFIENGRFERDSTDIMLELDPANSSYIGPP